MSELFKTHLYFNATQEELDKIQYLRDRLNMTWSSVIREGFRVMESMEKDIQDSEEIGSCVQVAWHERIKRVQLNMPKRKKRALPFVRKYIYWISEGDRKKYNVYYKDKKEDTMKVTKIKSKSISQEVLRKFSLGFEDFLK